MWLAPRPCILKAAGKWKPEKVRLTLGPPALKLRVPPRPAQLGQALLLALQICLGTRKRNSKPPA